MRLTSLGLADIPWPARKDAGPAAGPVGISGTSMFGGWLRDPGEYNSELCGTAAFQTYEKMRRSDAQVYATLAAMKLPIRGAEWTAQAPRDATAQEKEATDFIRVALLEGLDWDQTISNALLMLDFGCSCHEDVYRVDGNRVAVEELAPRLPSTFNRWICEPGTERLAAIEQYGETPDGGYRTVELPMSQCALFTHQQEGSNWAGRSVLRAAYQHWYVKSNLYKIDAIAQERNGMGIPWVQMGPDAKQADRDRAHEWVKSICAHESAGMVLPDGWTFRLEGVSGTVRDMQPSIAHHNVMISMAALAMFLNLGQSESGNRALGESQTDFFQMALQATAAQIARVLQLSTVARLVRWNFGEKVRPPRVAPAQIKAVEWRAVVSALRDLAGAGQAMAGDPEVEKWLRGKMGLPEASEGARGRGGERTTGDRDAATRGRGDTANERPDGAAQAGQDAAGGDGTGVGKAALSDASEGLRLRRTPGTVGSEGARRAERCLALSEIVGELDRGRDEIAAALRAAAPAVRAEVVQRLMSAPVGRMHRVSVELPGKLVARVEEILRGVQEFGAQQVERERAAQLRGAEAPDAAVVRVALAERRGRRDPLGVYADGVVSEFVNAVQSRATNVALDWQRRPGDLTAGEVIKRIEADLDEQSDKWIDPVASKGTNEAFADGRAEGYEGHADEIASVIYSALLDINTCENCAAADGAEGATPDEVPDVPNPDCDGGDRCRCVHVYVFRDEKRS